MRVVLAHPETQHSFQAALALQEHALLRAFVTGFYFRAPSPLSRLVDALPSWAGAPLRRQLLRRRLVGLDESLIRDFPLETFVTTATRRSPFLDRIAARLSLQVKCLERFYQRAASLVEQLRPDAVVAYDSAALEVFRAAKKVGALKILDQSSAHVHVTQQIFDRAGVPSTIATDVLSRTLERTLTEVEIADWIVTSSEFARNSLTAVGAPATKVEIIPYGVDTERFRPVDRDKRDSVNVLYVGRMNHRKGIQYLMPAFARLQHADLWLDLVGPAWGDLTWTKAYGPNVRYHGVLPNHELHHVYQRADFFVQLSLAESSAMTIYEALASGLPVITTPNSGSVVRDGVEGFIIPICDAAAAAEKIELLYRDPELRRWMAHNARKRAEDFTWPLYRQRFASFVQDRLAGQSPA